MFSTELCQIFKNTSFYRISLWLLLLFMGKPYLQYLLETLSSFSVQPNQNKIHCRWYYLLFHHALIFLRRVPIFQTTITQNNSCFWFFQCINKIKLFFVFYFSIIETIWTKLHRHSHFPNTFPVSCNQVFLSHTALLFHRIIGRDLWWLPFQ